MTRNLLDDTTRQALLGLDPGAAELDAAEVTRADATLARILTADLKVLPISGSVPPHPRRMRRVALLGAAAMVAAVAVVGTELLGGGSPAYASWTATPHQPTTSQQIAAATACRESLLASYADTPPRDPGGLTRNALRRASAVLAEQRGDWTLVVLGDRGGLDASCVVQDDNGSATDKSWEASGYRESLDPGPRDIFVSSGGTGGSRNNLLSVLIGFVGTDVTGVTVHTAENDVTATVENGHVAAWWPGPRGVSVTDPQLGTTVNATVTYSDGTTEERRLDVGPNPG